jgi:hypothetical protein
VLVVDLPNLFAPCYKAANYPHLRSVVRDTPLTN